MKRFETSGLRFAAGGSEDPAAPVCWVHAEGDEITERLLRDAGDDAYFVFFTSKDDMPDCSPWPAPGLYAGGEDFKGGAELWLREIRQALPTAEEGRIPCSRYIAGYSLGGLFALYAVTAEPMFSGAAGVSASFWYEGWREWAEAHPPLGDPSRIYLSVGSKEKKTRNPRMASVQKMAERTAELWRECADLTFELNPGNHFTDVDGRMLAGIRYLIKK